jgi:putative hydrolase of the HAD superfamily
MTSLVLFDFGGVVLRTPFELFPDEVTFRGPFDPANDDLWRESIDGRISERDYWHRRAAEFHPEAEDPTYTLMRQLYETDEHRLVRPELLSLLDELQAAGLRTAVLTNDLHAFHGDAWVERITVLRRFEVVIDLSHIGFLKPAPEAYEHALKVLELPAGEVLFVDDQPLNVEGAHALGIPALRFDPTDVRGSVAAVTEAVSA